MDSVLIVKFGAIGDVIMAIPAAHELHLRGWRVDWVCGPGVAAVLDHYPWVNVILADERAIMQGSAVEKALALVELWRLIAGRRYTLAATLYYDPRYRLLALPVRAKRKMMLSNTERKFKLLAGRHHTDEYARILLGWPDEVRPESLAPVRAGGLPGSPLVRDGRARVVLAPGGARNMMRDDALRRWPLELYVALAAVLVAGDEIEVVLIGGPEDGWVREAFAGLAVVDLVGTLKISETLALLDEADVLVTHDTGPLHLGGVTGVGIVTVFGPVDPRGRLPQRAGALAIWGGEGFACRPCYDGRDYAPCPSNECMRQVTPAMVAGEVKAMLADRAAGRLLPPRVIMPALTIAGVLYG